MRLVALALLGIVSLPALAAPAPAEPCSPTLEVHGQMSSAISAGVLGHDGFTITCTRPPARDVCVGRIGTANFTPAGETTGFDFELFAESPASALQMQPLNGRAPPLYVALFEDPP